MPTTTTHLLFISGSAREGSLNKKLARLGLKIAQANGIPATFADLGDYAMPLYDGDLEARSGPPDNARKLKALMAVHNGVFIASPEYNAGVSPLLKNALDWVGRVQTDGEDTLQVYRTRVFALAAASTGVFAGARGLLSLRQTLELGLGALVLPDQVTVANAAEAFDERGHLKDAATEGLLKALVERLARTARPSAAMSA